MHSLIGNISRYIEHIHKHIDRHRNGGTEINTGTLKLSSGLYVFLNWFEVYLFGAIFIISPNITYLPFVITFPLGFKYLNEKPFKKYFIYIILSYIFPNNSLFELNSVLSIMNHHTCTFSCFISCFISTFSLFDFFPILKFSLDFFIASQSCHYFSEQRRHTYLKV